MHLLAADDETVGLVPLLQFKTTEIQVENFLAGGATSSVFRAEYHKEKYALKLPNKDHSELFFFFGSFFLFFFFFFFFFFSFSEY
jgi:hypothetical protein